MEIGSRFYYMLPKTATLLKENVERKRAGLKNMSGKGAEIWEGDQWHSTSYREHERQKELAMRLLQRVDIEDRIDILPRPIQSDIIEIGHMVQVVLPDDEEVVRAGIPWALIHILTPLDAQYISPLFNNLGEMVISNESPLGKTLIGQKRGSIATYRPNQKLQVLDTPEAIMVSNLFEILG
jgi:transcription elongation GreA/GreB family factor